MELYEQLGLTEEEWKRPMFESMVWSIAMLSSSGYDPMDAFDYQVFNYDAQVDSLKFQQICTMVGFDKNRIDDGQYVAEQMNELAVKLMPMMGTHPELAKVPAIISVSIIRYACSRYMKYRYKEDYYPWLAPRVISLVRES